MRNKFFFHLTALQSDISQEISMHSKILKMQIQIFIRWSGTLLNDHTLITIAAAKNTHRQYWLILKTKKWSHLFPTRWYIKANWIILSCGHYQIISIRGAGSGQRGNQYLCWMENDHLLGEGAKEERSFVFPCFRHFRFHLVRDCPLIQVRFLFQSLSLISGAITIYCSCKGSQFLAKPQGLDHDDFAVLYTDISVRVWNWSFPSPRRLSSHGLIERLPRFVVKSFPVS
jgi:hypothetical protein